MNALETAALAEQYLPFAMKLANKFARQYPFLRMEFESAAAYGVCRAAKYYNPTRGSFMTLAHLAIQRTLFACLEMERKKSPTLLGGGVIYRSCTQQPTAWQTRPETFSGSVTVM